MRFLHFLTLLTLLAVTTTANKAPTLLTGTPCTELLSTQADALLSATTPALLATQLVPTATQKYITTTITQAVSDIPNCTPSQTIHAVLIPDSPVSIFFPTDTPTAIPSLFATNLPEICKIHESSGLYKLAGIDDQGPGAAFLTFRGARMVAFDVSDDAIVRIEVKLICKDEEVGVVPFGEFTVGGLRDVLGRGFMVGRVGEA